MKLDHALFPGRFVNAVPWIFVAAAGLWPLWPGVATVGGDPVATSELIAYSGGVLAVVALVGLAGALVAAHHVLVAIDARIDAWALRAGRGLGAFRALRLAVPVALALGALTAGGWLAQTDLRKDARGNYQSLLDGYNAKAPAAYRALAALVKKRLPPASFPLPRPGADGLAALRALRKASLLVGTAFHLDMAGHLVILTESGRVVRRSLFERQPGRIPSHPGMLPRVGRPTTAQRKALDAWARTEHRANLDDELVRRVLDARGYVRKTAGFAPSGWMPLVYLKAAEAGAMGFEPSQAFMYGEARQILRDAGFIQDTDWFVGRLEDDYNLYPGTPLARPRDVDAAIDGFILTVDQVVDGDRNRAHFERTVAYLVLLAMLFLAGLIEAARQLRALLTEREMAMAQSGFVSGVSHEMRTPLATIRLYAELLDQGLDADAAQRRDFHHAILTECDRLHRLIENVLDYARISGKRRTYAFVPTDLRPLLDEAVASAKGPLAAAGMACEVHAPVPVVASVDRDAVVQALANLLTNAAKYAASGGKVRLTMAPRGGQVAIAVQDFGPGIPADEREKVFLPFYRIGGGAAGGTGLGLSLVRSYVEAHGGSVALEGRPGEGTTVTILLPAEARVVEGVAA